MINKKLGFALIAGMIIFMPFEGVQFGSLGITDLFVVALMLTAAVALWQARARARFYIPLFLPFWVVWMGSLIGTLSALDIPTALFTLFQDFYLFLMLTTLVNVVVEEGTFLTIVKIWATVSTAESVFLMLDKAGIRLPLLSSGGKGAIAAAHGQTLQEAIDQLGRAIGTFANANAAGAYMMISLFFLLAIPFPRNRRIRAAMIVLHLIGILLTGSNSALAATGVGLLVLCAYWWYFKAGRPLLFSAGVVMTLVVLAGVATPAVLPLVSGTSVDKSNLLYNYSHVGDKLGKRLDLWNQAVQNLEAHPLGIGPNVARNVDTKGLHDDYIAFLSERGMLGFIGLLLLIGELVFCLALATKKGRLWHQHQMTGALLAASVGIWIMAAVHEVFHGRPVWVLAAFIFLHYRFVSARAHAVAENRVALTPALAQAASGD